MRIVCRAATAFAVALAATVSTSAHAVAFDQLVIFGDSLSDTGNNALALPPLLGLPPGSTTPVPVPNPPGNAFIPLLPYASGRYTNAGVWADTFAAAFGVSAAPSLLGGTNFAAGGATTGPIDPALPTFSTYPPGLLTQMAVFLATAGGASPGALYVIAGGGNNARATFDAIVFGGGNPAVLIPAGAIAYANDVATMVDTLTEAGATKIVLWNTPDVGTTPAARSGGPAAIDLATTIAAAMNAQLLATLGGAGLLDDVMLFDIFALVQMVTGDPAAFDLTNAVDACAQFSACILDPSGHFFWDGIHPTAAGHAILARAMIAFVPEPGALALLAVALLGLVWVRTRKAA